MNTDFETCRHVCSYTMQAHTRVHFEMHVYCEGCSRLSLQIQIMNTCNNYVYMHACLQIWMFVRLYLYPCNYVRTSLCMYVRRCTCMDGWMYGSMHVCIYALMYVCMFACLHVCRCAGVHVYVDVWMYVCIFASLHVCRCACVCGCMDVCMHVCVCSSMHAYVDVCMYVCKYVCMYVRMYVCMHAFMHLCMHAWMHPFLPVKMHVHMCIFFCRGFSEGLPQQPAEHVRSGQKLQRMHDAKMVVYIVSKTMSCAYQTSNTWTKIQPPSFKCVFGVPAGFWLRTEGETHRLPGAFCERHAAAARQCRALLMRLPPVDDDHVYTHQITKTTNK